MIFSLLVPLSYNLGTLVDQLLEVPRKHALLGEALGQLGLLVHAELVHLSYDLTEFIVFNLGHDEIPTITLIFILR